MKSIILYQHEINALKEGRLKWICRPMKVQPPDDACKLGSYLDKPNRHFWYREPVRHSYESVGFNRDFSCPFIPGQPLWVKEAFYECVDNNDVLRYTADGTPAETERRRYLKRSAVHLPEKHSRFTITPKEVMVVKTSEITEEDADAAGFKGFSHQALANWWTKQFPRYPWGCWAWECRLEDQDVLGNNTTQK